MASVIKIGKTVIPYQEIKSRRSKRISLRVTPEKVRVSAPVKASKREIQAFIETNQEWILENWLKLQKTIVEPSVRYYESGVKVPYIGEDLEIQILETAQKVISARYESKNHLILMGLPPDVSSERSQDVVREILEKWYKMKARSVFVQKLDSWSKVMGVRYNQFRLKEQKTRWGSCSSLGNINLNWRVIMAPEQVIDYLVIHELAHLKYLNHSQEFWNVVAEFCPDHESLRSWLRKNGQSLII